MDRQHLAYAQGIFTKLAEHQVDPAVFVEHAASSGNRALVKMAQILVEASQQTKTANSRLQSTMDLPENLMARGRAAMAPSPAPQMSEVPPMPPLTEADITPELLTYIGAHGHRPGGARSVDISMQPDHSALNQEILSGLQIPAGVAGAGAGAAGLGYGMTDADTWQNDLRNASNQYLGTDLNTQSKLRHGYDSLPEWSRKSVLDHIRG